ncbi:MAG: GAF domain-containing protein, partial [Myxococcales bacterium]
MLDSWKRFTAGQPAGGALSKVILESWERCRSFELDFARANLRRMPLPELRAVLDANAELIRAARPHLNWALAAMAPLQPVIVILADRNGIVVDSVGNAPEAMAAFGLIPGYDWSEQAMGTNGIGTALSFGAPVAVVGAEHYISTWHNNTCVGAPIYDAGRLVGAVDICTMASDGDPARLVLASFLAHLIARELGGEAPAFPDPAVLTRADVPEGSAHGATLERHADDLAALADKLLDAAHLYARRLSLVRQKVELTQVVQRIADSYPGVTVSGDPG